MKNIKFSWNLFQNKKNTLQKRVHEWVQSFSVWKSANRGVKIRFHMPQKVTFCSKTLHDISWINSARLKNNFDPILELLYNFHDLKKKCCRFLFCFTLYVWHDRTIIVSLRFLNVPMLNCCKFWFFATLRVKYCETFQITRATVNKIKGTPIEMLWKS